MLRQKVTRLVAWLVGAALLAACVPGAPQATTGNPAPDQATVPTAASQPAPTAGLPALAGEQLASSPVALAFNPTDDTLLLARSDGLYRGQRGTWASVSPLEAGQWSGAVLDPDQPEMIYASGLGLGIWRSDDGGANWRAINKRNRAHERG